MDNDTPTGGDAPDTDVQVEQRQPYLEVMFGPQAGKTFSLGSTRIVVGRGGDADFVLDDITMSRHHVAVNLRSHGYRVTDLGSGNGIRVNGESVPEGNLEEGSTLELGSTVLVLRFGEVVEALAMSKSLREMDTQELLVLDELAVAPIPGAVRDEAMPPNGPELKRRSSSSWSKPPRVVIQLLSWLVILGVVSGSILLVLNVLQSTRLGGHIDGKDGDRQTTESAVKPLVMGGRIPQPPLGEGTLDQSSANLVNAPDVALEKFNAASKLEADLSFREALELYQEINSSYPEFQPPDEVRLSETIGRLEKRIKFSDTVAAATAALDGESTDKAEFQELVVDLSRIPSTDPGYGDLAMVLLERARSRLKALELARGEPPPVVLVVEPDVREDPNLEVVEEADAPSDEQNELVDDALKRAARKYRKGDFDEAARTVSSAANKAGHEGLESKLSSYGSRIKEFGESYKQARKLARKSGSEDAAADAFSTARKLDSGLFDSYGKRIDDQLVELFAEKAERELEKGRYAAARGALDRVRKIDSSARRATKMESLFSYRAATLLRKAREAEDLDKALGHLDDAIALAGKGAGVELEAERMRAKLVSESKADDNP